MSVFDNLLGVFGTGLGLQSTKDPNSSFGSGRTLQTGLPSASVEELLNKRRKQDGTLNPITGAATDILGLRP